MVATRYSLLTAFLVSGLIATAFSTSSLSAPIQPAAQSTVTVTVTVASTTITVTQTETVTVASTTVTQTVTIARSTVTVANTTITKTIGRTTTTETSTSSVTAPPPGTVPFYIIQLVSSNPVITTEPSTTISGYVWFPIGPIPTLALNYTLVDSQGGIHDGTVSFAGAGTAYSEGQAQYSYINFSSTITGLTPSRSEEFISPTPNILHLTAYGLCGCVEGSSFKVTVLIYVVPKSSA